MFRWKTRHKPVGPYRRLPRIHRGLIVTFQTLANISQRSDLNLGSQIHRYILSSVGVYKLNQNCLVSIITNLYDSGSWRNEVIRFRGSTSEKTCIIINNFSKDYDEINKYIFLNKLPLIMINLLTFQVKLML